MRFTPLLAASTLTLAGCLLITGCSKASNDDTTTPDNDESAMADTSRDTLASAADDAADDAGEMMELITDETSNNNTIDEVAIASPHDAHATAEDPLAGFGPPPPAGDVAPDIEGIDLDGTPFKLSDYKDKVIFLDFWGDW